MEADSTTYDNLLKETEICLPFSANSCNYSLHKELTAANKHNKKAERQIIERLQQFGLIPIELKCTAFKQGCKMICKPARVIDRLQWVCEGCGLKQPIRTGSFFFRLQCSILQALQLILAWCEDADLQTAATHFGLKSRVAHIVYDKLDNLAIAEQSKVKLGGENSVVVAEMYPDCLNRLSPDTTDQPHVHRILMLADTNHIPTRYWLHVLKEDKRSSGISFLENQGIKAEIEKVIADMTEPNSTIVIGNYVPQLDNASSIQQLLQYCDADMQHFLSTRIWRQAVSLCAASRDICSASAAAVAGAGAAAGAGAGAVAGCGAAVQRYLTPALHRLRHHDDFYRHTLQAIADEYSQDIALQ